MIETVLYRVKRSMKHKSPLVQIRNKREIASLKFYIPALWSMEKYFRFSNPELNKKIRSVRLDAQSFLEQGLMAKIVTRLVGSLLFVTTLYSHLKRNILKVPKEPRTFREIITDNIIPENLKSKEATPSSAAYAGSRVK